LPIRLPDKGAAPGRAPSAQRRRTEIPFRPQLGGGTLDGQRGSLGRPALDWPKSQYFEFTLV